MFRISCRGWVATAAVVVGLVSSKPAGAQVLVYPSPGPGGQNNSLTSNVITGVEYDIVNRRLAERRLNLFQAKLKHDTEHGKKAAASRDVQQINNVNYRIVVDGWLIRKNSLCDPGYYPLRIDTDSVDALVQAGHP